MVLRQLDIYAQKNEFGPVLYIIYKKYSKYINDLNVKAKTTKQKQTEALSLSS